MRDAGNHAWADEPSLRTLNRRFLDLKRAAEVRPRIAALTGSQREAAAKCPYALFDLRFQDENYWLSRLATAPAWRVADEQAEHSEEASFAAAALFYAWHLARIAPRAVALVLGVTERTAAEFRRLTVDRLPDLAASEGRHLGVRWPQCDAYWSALLDAAAHPSPERLRHVQLFGIQLAAAARLP